MNKMRRTIAWSKKKKKGMTMKSMKKTRTGNMKLTVKAIFETELTALKGHQRWCRAFYDHMQGLDGKTLSEQNANRRARQLFTILHSIDPNSDMLDCLYQEKGSKIWDEWAKPKLEKKTKAGIVIFYLTSLETSNKGQVESNVKTDKGLLDPQYNASLEILFEEEIRSMRVPTIKEVKTRLSQSKDMCHLVNSERALKQCVKCFRYVIFCNTRKLPDNGPPVITRTTDLSF